MVPDLDHTLTTAGCVIRACIGQGLLCSLTNLELQGVQVGVCRCSSDCRCSYTGLRVTSSLFRPASNNFLHHGFQCRCPKAAVRDILALDYEQAGILSVWENLTVLLDCQRQRTAGVLRSVPDP